MNRIEGYSWAHDNLNSINPHELQDRGIQVYFAPSVKREQKVINLEDGSIRTFNAEENIKDDGYFADFASLQSWCERKHHLFYETNGTVTVGLTDKHLESIG